MLNEAKISRPRPRPRPGSWGRDRGWSFEVKAEAQANFLRSRPRPRLKKKLWIKSIKCWLTTYRRIYIIMIKTTQFISHSLYRTVTIFYHSVMSCSRQSKVQNFFLAAAAGSYAADRGQAQAKCLRPRPRPKLWGRDRGRGQNLPHWPRGLNISALRQLYRLEIIRGSLRQIISEIISVLPSPVAQQAYGD